MKNVPKIGHFIWIGGRLPFQNQDCVRSFTQNADWHFNLWVDPYNLLVHERRNRVKQKVEQKISDGGDKNKVQQKQWDKVVKAVGKEGTDQQTKRYLVKKYDVSADDLDRIADDNYKQLSDFCRENKMGLCSVAEFQGGKSFSLYRQEMVARNTNFGSASDILRVDILLKFGGVYFDTDVYCREPLGDIAAPKNAALWSAVHMNISSKTVKVTKTQWEDDEWWKQFGDVVPICNSTIACHPGSQALQDYRNLIDQNYSGKMTKAARQQYYQNIRSDTIQRTGPTAAMKSSGLAQKKEDYWNDVVTSTDVDRNKALLHQRLLEFRERVYFPMYKLSDQFYHQWL